MEREKTDEREREQRWEVPVEAVTEPDLIRLTTRTLRSGCLFIAP